VDRQNSTWNRQELYESEASAPCRTSPTLGAPRLFTTPTLATNVGATLQESKSARFLAWIAIAALRFSSLLEKNFFRSSTISKLDLRHAI
jgi:hypothetical protein